jgi:transcription-repair coupling factor (superfamily II helicase)
MINLIFGPEFRKQITGDTGARCTRLDNIHRDMVELAVAGTWCMDNTDKTHSASRPLVWVVGVNENLREKAARLRLWLQLLTTSVPDIRYYIPPFEDPYINNSDDPNAVAYKVRLLSAVRDRKPLIIITTLPALSIKIEAMQHIPGFFLKVNVEGETDRDELIRVLTGMGYRSRNIVEERGDIAWRGSIVDVFPVDSSNPLRIEIEGDTVISIRIFDPDTQKSLKRIETVDFSISRFFLGYETCSDCFNSQQDGMLYLTDLLGHYRLVVSDKKKAQDEFAKLLDHYENLFGMVNEPGKLPPGSIFRFPFEEEKIIDITETWDDISGTAEWVKLQKSIADLNLEDIRDIREKVDNSRYRLVICSDKEEPTRLEENFKPFDFIRTKIPFSFENFGTRTIFLAEKPFQFVEKVKEIAPLKSERLLHEIQVNDLVVHQTHGIGRFTGFKRLTFENHVTEFLKIEYLGKEFLYVPVYELDVLSKYVSFEGHSPKMDKLGGNSWALKNKRARKSIIHFARDLLELYAMRKAVRGSTYPADYELENKLGEEFEYVETGDQKRAIKDVLVDLEAEFPMDRLICGDVSFGKTEVALRAALRVAANGKQVAILCPTTILAFQHFSTFKNRFSDFPVTVAMLSRMVSQKKKKSIYNDLATGKIDVVIGTHALLARDVSFKRLGLYIIDEEQRFGVFQKEKLKKNREEIDVLSMSATPIPRTLSLSLAGLQDISTIRTPPIGRQAVKNFVGYFSKEIVVSAVLNEVERDGQVFIVYNNIDKIYTFRDQLDAWMPHVPNVVIHAKMKTQEIETNLMDFIAKQYRVLLSTTIIENGIDIPDVNTLIVLDAERFGLTQLYQLRGRIGRSSRQAYAYFLVKTMNVSDKAKSRLDAIREFADLGSGYKLAEFDLKLRGAGSLLGNRQHGHIEALGFDYYHQLLVKTIKELKGEEEKKKEAKINIHFSYSIESAYINNSAERITLYRRILEAEDFERIDELKAEMADRYGRPHPSIEKIFFAGMVRVMAKKYQLEEVEVYLDKVIIKFPLSPDLQTKLEARRNLPRTIDIEPFGNDERTRVFHFPDFKTFPQQFARFWETPSSA